MEQMTHAAWATPCNAPQPRLPSRENATSWKLPFLLEATQKCGLCRAKKGGCVILAHPGQGGTSAFATTALATAITLLDDRLPEDQREGLTIAQSAVEDELAISTS